MADELETASQLIDTVPLVMQALRGEIRSHRPAEFSVPQFRVLAYLGRNPGAALTDLANHIGLMRPTMSKMVDNLVRRGWIERETSAEDRRYMRLCLTSQGRTAIDGAKAEMRQGLAETLRTLSTVERESVVAAMELLRRVFATGSGTGPREPRR